MMKSHSDDGLVEPNPWLTSLPTQLRAWDATAIRLAQECPRKFQYAQIEGRRSGSVHTEWGGYYHGAVETFDKAILAGASKEEATDAALAWALDTTWTPEGPWRGEHMPAWRCGREGKWKHYKDGEDYIDAETAGKIPGLRARTALCPMAKLGWRLGQAPEQCPTCGHATNRSDHYFVSDDRYKNRYTLIRAVVAYCDDYDPEGHSQPFAFPDGRPAVELSFALPLPMESPDGTPYLLTGNIDSLMLFLGDLALRERKTTKSSVDDRFFEKYSPDVQFDTYDVVTWLLYSGSGVEVRAKIAEIMQIGIGFARIERKLIPMLSEGGREEHLRDIMAVIKEFEGYAHTGYYPKRTNSCAANGGCPFRRICRMSPEGRGPFLEANHPKGERWNPLAER